MQSSLLYLIICSNAKISGGEPLYKSGVGFADQLSPSNRDYLFYSRRKILSHIKLGGGTRQGIKLLDLPYNSNLREARDFQGKEKGIFLRARSRYAGRLYSEISKSSWENRSHHILIISGLYGLLLPEEPIQLYSLNLGDSRIIFDVWEDGLSLLVEDYVKKNGISTVIDCTGGGSVQ